MVLSEEVLKCECGCVYEICQSVSVLLSGEVLRCVCGSLSIDVSVWVCCSVLQAVAGCCIVLQCVALCYSVLQCTIHTSRMRCIARAHAGSPWVPRKQLDQYTYACQPGRHDSFQRAPLTLTHLQCVLQCVALCVEVCVAARYHITRAVHNHT